MEGSQELSDRDGSRPVRPSIQYPSAGKDERTASFCLRTALERVTHWREAVERTEPRHRAE